MLNMPRHANARRAESTQCGNNGAKIMTLISRRDLISAGVVVGASALLPRQLFALSGKSGESAAQSATSSVGDFLAVSPVSDPSSAIVLNGLFPGLLPDPGFEQLRPVAFLVTNLSRSSVRAFSTHWIFTTPGYTREMSLMHYFHPRAGYMGRKRMHWGTTGNRTRLTGRIPIIKAGATRLVTPFFNWSPSFYKQHGDLDWGKLLRRRARPEVVLSDLAKPGASVAMTISAAITKDYAWVGPDGQELARVFSVTRNAEHDEAVSVLKRISAGASPEQVREQLRHHASGLAFDIQPSSDLYYRVRQRQAKVLLRRLKKARWDQFLRTLEYLRKQPPTRTHPISFACE
jgi:hypothetical protein